MCTPVCILDEYAAVVAPARAELAAFAGLCMPLILAELDPWYFSGHFISKHTLRLADMLCQENFHFLSLI